MIDKWPWVLTWLNWCLYAHGKSLIVCVVAVSAHRWYYMKNIHISMAGISLVLFVSFCLWVVWCALKNGYAVG